MDVDTALATVGGYKRWHLAMFSFLGISGFMPLCWQGLSIVFLGISPDHHCKVPEGSTLNQSIPWIAAKGDTNGHWDKCNEYTNSTIDNTTKACSNGWTYMKEDYEKSIVTEWDLVCEKDYLGELSQSIYQVGALLGEILCSVLVDKFGRRLSYLMGTVIIIILGSVTAFSPHYIFFCVVRAFMAAAVLGQCWAAETIMMEIFDSKRRAFAGIGLEALWVIDYMILAGLAYLLQNWRHLQLAISVLLLPALVAVWILPESPMWLVANGKVEEAEKVLQDMARKNGVKISRRLLPPSDHQTSEMNSLIRENQNGNIHEPLENSHGNVRSEKPPMYSWTDLFKDPTLRRLTTISSLLWFGNSVVYYALILAAPSMPGDIYINFLLGAVIEIPAYFVTYPIVVKFGRRTPTVISHIVAGVFLGAIVFIPAKTESGTDLAMLHGAFALLGKFSITISFAIIILYTKEVFPTNLRASSGGICSVPARIGTMCAPFASYAAKHIPWLSNTIMAAISLIAAAITLLLPETMDVPLPQTIEDVKKMYIGHKTLSLRRTQKLSPKKTDLNENKPTRA